MLKIKIILFLFFLLPWISLAQKTDIVIMHNGIFVIGEIKVMQFGMLTFKTDDMGTLGIEWKKINHLISKFIFEVDLKNGTILLGSLDSTSVAGQVIVKTEKDTFNLSKNDIVGIAPIKSSFWERITGSVSLGFNYAKGSGTGQLNFAGNGTFRSKKWNANISLNSIFSFRDQEQSSSNQNLSFTLQRLLPNKWLLGTLLSFEQNTELGIQLRTSITPQGGYMFMQSNTYVFWGVAGLSLNREEFTDTTEGNNNLDGYAQLQYQVFIYDHPKTSLTTYLNAYPGLTDWGRLRANFNIVLDWEILRNFYWDLSYYFSYDNRPSGDSASNDYGINTSLKFRFNQ